MDLTTKQAKQSFNQPKKKPLILEERHSISIEAANKIRSSLSPRMFIPRAKRQNRSKELKLTHVRNENLQNSLCQTELEKDFAKRVKGKLKKRPQCDKRGKSREDKISLYRTTNRCKIRKKPQKRTKTKQNLKNPMNMQMGVTAKEIAIRSWGNLKVFECENSEESAIFVTDDEIIFMDDPLAINIPDALYKDKNTSEVKNLETNAVEIFKKPDLLNKNNPNFSNLQIDEQNKIARKRICDSKIMPTGVDLSDPINAKWNAKQQYNKTNEIKSCAIISGENNTNSVDLGNSPKSLCTSEDVKTLNSKENMGSKVDLQNIVVENLTQTIKRKKGATVKTKKQAITCNKEPIATIKEKNQQFINNANTKHSTTTKSSKTNNNVCITKTLKSANSLAKHHPLYSYLHPATNAVGDFQNAVRCSFSLTYDHSPIDQRINEYLTKLEASVESFSNYLLQSYNDVEEKELKTNNCIEYLRKKELMGRILVQSSRSQTSILNQPKVTEPTSETLTVVIEAETMPTQSITYKMSDILYCKLINNDKNSNSSQLFESATTEALTNSICKPKTNKNGAQLRRKAAPKKAISEKPLLLNTQNQTSSSLLTNSCNAYANNCLISATNSTNTYNNVTYTQAHNYNYSYSASNSLGSQSTAYKSSNLITSQLLAHCPPPITNFYNYSLARTEDLNIHRIPLTESPTTPLLHANQNFSRGPSQVLNETPNRFEYHSSLCRVPYLRNHYNHHASESNAYDFQLENNLGSLVTTNLPAFEDIHMNYG